MRLCWLRTFLRLDFHTVNIRSLALAITVQNGSDREPSDKISHAIRVEQPLLGIPGCNVKLLVTGNHDVGGTRRLGVGHPGTGIVDGSQDSRRQDYWGVSPRFRVVLHGFRRSRLVDRRLGG
jgi:hypothetical protein